MYLKFEIQGISINLRSHTRDRAEVTKQNIYILATNYDSHF